jgi:hypothetical protein
MKKYFYLPTLALVLIIAGCSKKGSTPAAPIPIDGYWYGFYKMHGTTKNNNVSLLVRPGGTLRLYSLDHRTDTMFMPADLKVDGTWTFSGNVFEFDFPVAGQHITGSLSRSTDQTKLNGTYSVEGVIAGIMEYNKK